MKGCGNLKSHPDQLIDAIIYGRDLGPEGEDFITEERFQRIKFYLKNGRYPDGADRSEKSRLRSAASHYRLLPATDNEPEKLMLKGKEVISDPQLQYETTRRIHVETHGGINKTTAAVAEKYHWIRIKETASQVIKNCPLCLAAATPSARNQAQPERRGPGGTWTLGHFYPFDREFSVPPGEPWLRSYGQLKDQSPQTPVAPPPKIIDLPAMEKKNEAEDAAETEAENYGMQRIDMADGIFGDGIIPVDPALTESMDGLDQARYYLDSQADAQLQAEAQAAQELAQQETVGTGAPMRTPRRLIRSKRGAGEIAEAPSVSRQVRSKKTASTISEAPSVGQQVTAPKQKVKQQGHANASGETQGDENGKPKRATRQLAKAGKEPSRTPNTVAQKS